MKVLLRRNVEQLGHVGDVVDVKPGYARNYLLPQGIAAEPTRANLRAIEEEKKRYLEELALQRKEIEARAALVNGREVTIPARANEEGHLYGSVGPAQIVAALAAEGAFIEPENVVLPEPIRRLDKYDLPLQFGEDVTATIHVWVVPSRDEEGEASELLSDDDAPADEQNAPETPADA